MIGWIAILVVIIVILILRLIIIVDITKIASGYSKACPKKRCEIIKKIVAEHQKSPQSTEPEPELRGPDEIFSDQKLVADRYNFTRTTFEELPIAIFEYKDLESDVDWGVDNYPAVMDSKTYYQKNNSDVIVPNGMQFMSVHEMQPIEINDPEWTFVD